MAAFQIKLSSSHSLIKKRKKMSSIEQSILSKTISLLKKLCKSKAKHSHWLLQTPVCAAPLRGDPVWPLGSRVIGKSHSEQPLLGWCVGSGQPKTGNPRRVWLVNYTEAAEEPFRITVRANDDENVTPVSGEEHVSTGATFPSLILVNL